MRSVAAATVGRLRGNDVDHDGRMILFLGTMDDYVTRAWLPIPRK